MSGSDVISTFSTVIFILLHIIIIFNGQIIVVFMSYFKLTFTLITLFLFPHLLIPPSPPYAAAAKLSLEQISEATREDCEQLVGLSYCDKDAILQVSICG